MSGCHTDAIILDIVESLEIRCLNKNLRRKAAKEKLDPFDMMIVEVKPLAPFSQIGENLV